MATSGIREGRARFGDDVRERARKYFEAQKKGKGSGAQAIPVKPPADTKGKPLSAAKKPAAKKPAPPKATKPATKPAPKAAPEAPMTRVLPAPKYAPSVPRQPLSQGPKAERDAAAANKSRFGMPARTDKAAAAREKMFAAKSPIEDIADAAKAKFSPKPAPDMSKAKPTPYSSSDSSPMLMNAKRRREMEARAMGMEEAEMKKGGKVKKMAKGGSVSKRADGIAQRGKTKGRML